MGTTMQPRRSSRAVPAPPAVVWGPLRIGQLRTEWVGDGPWLTPLWEEIAAMLAAGSGRGPFDRPGRAGCSAAEVARQATAVNAAPLIARIADTGELVGVCWARFDRVRRTVTIDRVDVAAESRRVGAARRLVAATVQAARASRFVTVRAGGEVMPSVFAKAVGFERRDGQWEHPIRANKCEQEVTAGRVPRWDHHTMFAFDIETDTTVPAFGDGVPAGLDPRVAPVRSIAVAGEFGAAVFDDRVESRLLRQFFGWLADDDTAGGLLVSWNGAMFDVPYLDHRIRRLGLSLPVRTWPVPSGVHHKYAPLPGRAGPVGALLAGAGHCDISGLWYPVATALGVRAGLKPVAAAVGLDPVVEDASQAGSLSVPARCAYNVSDALVTFELAARMGPLVRPDDAPVVV